MSELSDPLSVPAEARDCTGNPVEPGATGACPLTEPARIGNTFLAPSKTFTDIMRNARWWPPFLLGVLVSCGFLMAVSQRIGWEHVAQNSMAHATQQEQAKMAALPAAQQVTLIRQVAMVFRISAIASPVLSLIFLLVIALVLFATMRVLFSGRASFKEVFALVNYAFLPNIPKYLLGTAMLYFAPDPDHFDLQTPVGTNIGYYLDPDGPKWLLHLAGSADLVSVWIVVLLVIGCAIVGRIKRKEAALAVVGWWVVVVLVGAAWAARG